MADANDELTIDLEAIGNAYKIIGNLAELKPETSFSFFLTQEGYAALDEAVQLTDWGMPGNMPKLKEAALEVLSSLLELPAGSPLNLNLTEYEVKSMEEVASLIERSLDRQKDGLLKK